jgi:molecular chaperone IbpA
MTNAYDQFSIGFDRIANALITIQNQANKTFAYPPYNVKRAGENTYIIELAVAGFGRQDIEITLENSILKIDGSTQRDAEDENTYIFKGIAERPFSRTFTLADTVEIKNAELINGMLRVWLDNMVPTKKARKVNISEPDGKPKPKPESNDYGYLTE